MQADLASGSLHNPFCNLHRNTLENEIPLKNVQQLKSLILFLDDF